MNKALFHASPSQLLLLQLCVFLLSLANLSGVSADNSTTVSSARQSELLYFLKHDCGSCHGMTLKGGLGPALLPKTLADKPEAFLITTILEGRAGTAMPPWKSMLSHDDARWLTRQLQKGQVPVTAIARKTDTVEGRLSSNSGRGNPQ